MEFNRCFGCMEDTVSNPCPHCGYDPQVSKDQDYALRPGTILHGKYLIGRVLGQGGFGITYIGWDLALSRKVAIKEYFPASYVTRDSSAGCDLQWYMTEQSQNARSEGRKMFLKEARKMNRVASVPLVVQVLDLFEDNETAYIIMEYIQGRDLMHQIEVSGPMIWPSVSKLLLPVVDTMQKVHDEGLIHRDLSPDNLMLLPDGSIKILDLGAAKDLNLSTGASSMQVAKSGFSPLEQYVQRGNSGTWTDVYSMAATMYYALTGVFPPSAVDRIEEDSLRWDLLRSQKVPAYVIQVLKQAMALHSNDRIQTMNEFAACLRQPGQVTKQRRNHTAKILAAIVPLILLCIWGISLLGKLAGADGEDSALTPHVSVAATEQGTVPPGEPEMPWSSNVLMFVPIPEDYSYNMDEAPVFNSRISRFQIKSVTFLDSLKDAGPDSWDVSQNRDGSVLAWTVPNGDVSIWKDSDYVIEDAYDLYIAAEGGINGKYSNRLFNGFQNMESVTFNRCFHTDYAESMEYMFAGCYSLKELDVSELQTSRVRNMRCMFQNCDVAELDVSGFDTSNVEDMGSMFNQCSNLTALDLSSFDTSKVVSMQDMFCLCSSLTRLDISSFQTSNVRDMSFMFSYVELTQLDLSHFDTAQVANMAYMFSNSDKLISVDLSSFNTSKVDSMAGMFEGCKQLEMIVGLEDLDTSNVRSYDSFMDEGTLVDGASWEKLFQ